MTDWPRMGKPKKITIWLSLPYADCGIEKLEAEVSADSITVHTGCTITSYHNHHENLWWHRTKAAAIAQAEKFRRERISKAADELARLTALPPIETAL
jgi:hypothetical protein